MKLLFSCIFVCLMMTDCRCAMSDKQVKAAAKLVRNVCQPKTKVTNEQIKAMHQGEFVEDRALMCYMECCLRTGMMTKDGKLDHAAVLIQASNLPIARRQLSIDAANQCKDAGSSSEKCEAAFQIYKCFYYSNPENFFMP